MQLDQIVKGDCLDIMQSIPDKSIDAIIYDLPYGVLNKSNASAKWDNIIPFEPMWAQFERVIKDNGAIVLFGQGMFTAKLMMSNTKLWRRVLCAKNGDFETMRRNGGGAASYAWWTWIKGFKGQTILDWLI